MAAHKSRVGKRWNGSMGSDAARATEMGDVEGFYMILEGREMVCPALNGDDRSARCFLL